MAFGAKIKLSVNTSGASAFRSEIQKYVNTATANNPIKLKNFSVSITKEQQKKIVRDIQTYLSGDTALTLKIGKIDATGAVNKLRQQLQTMLSGLSITGLKEFLGETNIEKITQDIDKAKQSASQWAAQMRVVDDIQKRLGSTYKTALSGGQMLGDATQVSEITAEYTAWQVKVEELRNTKIALSAEEIQNLQQEGIAIQQKISLIQEERAATARASTEAERAAAREEIAARKRISLAQQQISLKAQVQRYILSNSKAYKAYGSELDGIMQLLQSESSLTNEELKQIRMRFYEIQRSAQAAGKSGNTFFDTLKKGWEKFGGWSLVTKSMMAVIRLFKDMISSTKELDAAMTELKKVTDLTDASYTKFLTTATTISKSIGTSLADTVNATADFARLGYTVTEATSLAEAALVYKNVGDGIDDISIATESLISTIKAFGIEAEDALSIVDRFNEVGNRFAISSEGIGTALQKSASALAAANNSLEESIALVTGMNAVIQNPEVVGTALKTVSMYLRAAKTEAEETGEATDGMANSVSELRDELLTLTNNKVDIMLDDKSFKSTYQIMKELSEVWSELSDIDAANILELIGGKRNATAITSLLTNFKDAEKSLATASDAAGSAMAENEKYLDSIAGKVDQFTASFEAMSANIVDSSIVKFVVDLGTGLVNVISSLQEANLLLPLLAASIAAIKYYQLYQTTKDTALQINVLVNRFVAEKTATDSLTASYWALTKAQQQEILVKLQEKVASGAITQSDYKEITAKLGLAAATTGTKVATDGLNVSIKALLLSNPIGWIITAISIIPMLVSWISSLHKSNEDLIEDANELNETFRNANQTITDNIATLQGLKNEFNLLSVGVTQYGKNISLSADDYDRYKEIIQKIVEISPSLVESYDIENGYLVNKNELLERAIELQEEEYKKELQQVASTEGLNTALKGYIATYKEIVGNEGVSKKSKLETDLSNAYWRLYNTNNRDGYSGEDMAKDIMSAFGIENIENEIKKYYNKHGYYQISEFLDDYADRIAQNYKMLASTIDWREAGFESQEAFDVAISNMQAAADNWQQMHKDIEDVNKSISGQLQYVAEYNDNYTQLSEQAKMLVSNFTSSFDIDDITTTNWWGTVVIDEDKVKAIRTQIDNFVDSITPEIQDALTEITSVDKYNMSAQKWEEKAETLVGQIAEALNLDDEQKKQLMISVGFEFTNDDVTTVESMIASVKEALKDCEDFDGEINFNYGDLQKAFTIIKTEGVTSFADLLKKIREFQFGWDTFTEVMDFEPMADDLDDIGNKVSKLTSLMQTLANGTALTKNEIAKLALEYPKLLEASNLFTDGSIEGQQAMLDNILNVYEEQYDATIDEKIAELEATQLALNDQLEIEKQKQQIVIDLKVAEANGQIETEEQLIEIINKFKNLEGKNFVTFKDGELQANTDYINNILNSEDALGEQTTDIWNQTNANIVSGYGSAGSAVIDASKQTAEKSLTFIQKIGNWFKKLGHAIKSLFSGDGWDFSLGDVELDGSTVVNTKDVLQNAWKSNKITIDDLSIGEWSDNQSKKISDRIDAIQSQIDTNLVIIDNLKNLKGLDLSSLYGSSSSSKKSSSDKSDKEGQLYDWIEIRIERLQSAIDKLKNVASGAYNTIGEKLGASFKQIEKINEEISIQQEMYKAYISYANSVGLSESLAKKVREGAIEISKYDSDTQELIESYKKWYEAALDCSDAVTTLHDDLAALYVDIFNNTKQDFEDQISLLEHTQKEYQHELDIIDELSHLGGEKYYKLLQSYEKEHIELLEQELDELQKKFDAAMASGEIEKYSEAWYDSKIAINSVKEAIADANTELIRHTNNLRNASKERFDFAEDRVSQLTQEADFLIGLFDEDGLTDDKGQLTDKGWSVAGLHAQNYDTYMLQADDYAKEMLKVNKELAKDPANTELIERREELLKLQQDSIKSAADEKSAIIDLVKNGIEKELSSLQKLIDTYNESLDSAKNLHDYQKNVTEKAAEIANIQKQMAAYANDSSEEARSKIQKLEVSLKDAREDLQETEYDRYISEQKQLLDDLYAEYEETINSRLDNVDGLLSEIFDAVNGNAETIDSAIRETAAEFGYTLTASMAQLWSEGAQGRDVISKYGQEISDKFTALNTVVADLYTLAYEKGDIDRNGSVDVSDARLALRYAVSLETPDAKSLRLADLNGDGVITVGEAREILNKAIGKTYATGGLADYTGLAKVDGSKQKPELVLNQNDTQNFLSLRDYLRKISAKPISIENGLNIQNDIITPIINEMTDVSRIIRDVNIPANMNTIGDINIQIERVQDYNDFITQLQHDPKAERMIQAMTLGQATGKGSLSKYGVSWR